MASPDLIPAVVGRIGMVARWRPVHLGQAAVLSALCDRAEQAFIGIGSANRYNLRNPFTAKETMEMIHLTLDGRHNYTLLPINDLDDGPRWRKMILDIFGPLDLFVTENPYVTSLLAEDYKIVRPVSLIAEENKIPINGTMVRRAMAEGDDWREMVPAAVADFLIKNKLDQRFRREFGLQTLAMSVIVDK
jgi:nicotinamide-nucleotide adenylyltransferase